ncbi:YqgE/AlgH family protein [Inmirania thermothiophila]|uniref:Putative transcriptional regulator n=1 Tax=Inmirania thermothiophila TaxID=1750597 RepID=A0A3N1Y520_9GAMM|nr:YqgE/AlgH family protein [Inmirania thermothiophila]ROR32732.1 putative transcriptional regulator [Inmirania thermothiophila]
MGRLLALVALLIAGLARAAEPGPGNLLVAAPHLRDPNFVHTVVLLVSHGGGTMGLVLNRPSRVSVAEALPDIAALAGREDPLYIGGPVARGVVSVLARSAEALPKAREVIPGVWMSLSREALGAALARPETPWRAYAGYAGWAPGQLEAEIARGDWRVVPARAEDVFAADPEGLWRRLAYGQWALAPAGAVRD